VVRDCLALWTMHNNLVLFVYNYSLTKHILNVFSCGMRIQPRATTMDESDLSQQKCSPLRRKDWLGKKILQPFSTNLPLSGLWTYQSRQIQLPACAHRRLDTPARIEAATRKEKRRGGAAAATREQKKSEAEVGEREAWRGPSRGRL
jgi:hypothetical protein